MESVIFDSEKGRQVCTRLTICEIHRRIYDQVVIALDGHELLEQITKDLETAFTMGVKMNDRLVKYRIETIDRIEKLKGIYPQAPDVTERAKLRAERIRLTELVSIQNAVLTG